MQFVRLTSVPLTCPLSKIPYIKLCMNKVPVTIKITLNLAL